ncbi:four helix bundle protein [Roseisolibacter sp. H3M3-2]|uniref:four helix bundle protein n=1 Tax=Roseisolibacter sp. H3M3-2 TaxID=3031323 RepID=UPI0023DA5DDD|nr:four helix bundle protein [Roseisolibacter sp. H3M3-2]MDF1505752.1 four helix bundle protein [Roseisolibacter sp. H3M3-2]
MREPLRSHEPAASYHELRAWQQAIRLTETLGPLTAALHRSERRALGDQLMRAATSVHANTAEGSGRAGRRDMLRFLTIAWSSLLEVESHLVEAASIPRCPRALVSDARAEARRAGILLAALRRSLST